GRDEREAARHGRLLEDVLVRDVGREVETALRGAAVADVLRAAALLEDHLLDRLEGAGELRALLALRVGRRRLARRRRRRAAAPSSAAAGGEQRGDAERDHEVAQRRQGMLNVHWRLPLRLGRGPGAGTQ